MLNSPRGCIISVRLYPKIILNMVSKIQENPTMIRNKGILKYICILFKNQICTEILGYFSKLRGGLYTW